MTVVPMERWGGSLISSTRIRELLLAGEMEQANQMLGEPYAINRPVVHGKRIGGAKLGFPTINQRYPAGMLLPRSGIYITRATVNRKAYPAATGLGDRPTVGGTDITCESFLIGFDGNLYGDEVRLEFFRYIAPTRRFEILTSCGIALRMRRGSRFPTSGVGNRKKAAITENCSIQMPEPVAEEGEKHGKLLFYVFLS